MRHTYGIAVIGLGIMGNAAAYRLGCRHQNGQRVENAPSNEGALEWRGEAR